MKGIIFTELMSMVEEKFGYEMVDTMLNEAELPSKGIYTAVGTYAHSEIVELVTILSAKTDIPVPKLLHTYGLHVFNVFLVGYPDMFNGMADAFDMLQKIENHIHVEVQKLYPDAELPTFETELNSNRKQLTMTYISERKMADFAEGLITATLAHFKEEATLKRKNIEKDGSIVRFLITRK